MNRRNFIASLAAIPLVAKMLPNLAAKVKPADALQIRIKARVYDVQVWELQDGSRAPVGKIRQIKWPT